MYTLALWFTIFLGVVFTLFISEQGTRAMTQTVTDDSVKLEIGNDNISGLTAESLRSGKIHFPC